MVKEQIVVSGLWMGSELPFLAELCIRSYIFHGAKFQLFCYKQCDNIPDGTIIRDANDIIDAQFIFKSANGGLKQFTDWFRNKFLYENGGVWTELDIMCISPNIPTGKDIWFSFQEEGIISDRVIAFPVKHPVMQYLYQLCEDPANDAPWDNGATRLSKYHIRSQQPDAKTRREHALPENSNFSKMLRYFKLETQAESAESIHPVYYTVWRHCFDGQLTYDSPTLAKSWAVHVWNELFSREPYEPQQIHPLSVVGHLIRKLMPHLLENKKNYSQPIYSAVKSQPDTRVLVAICSCVKAKERRDIIQKTWLQQKVNGVQCLFFVGEGEGLSEERDCVQLAANDSYEFLPEKMLALFDYALENLHFDWIFKCDDDTYVKLDRLPELCDSGADFIGNPWIETRGAPSGGAGYMLSRDLVQKIIANRTEIPLIGVEDILIGELALRLCNQSHASHRLNYGNFPIPLPNNDFITAHWLSMERMLTVHELQTKETSFILYGKHPHWQDALLFTSNGIFMRKESGCMGKWAHGNDGSLTLSWFDWGEEILNPCEQGYQSGDFYLFKEPFTTNVSIAANDGGNINQKHLTENSLA